MRLPADGVPRTGGILQTVAAVDISRDSNRPAAAQPGIRLVALKSFSAARAAGRCPAIARRPEGDCGFRSRSVSIGRTSELRQMRPAHRMPTTLLPEQRWPYATDPAVPRFTPRPSDSVCHLCARTLRVAVSFVVAKVPAPQLPRPAAWVTIFAVPVPCGPGAFPPGNGPGKRQ